MGNLPVSGRISPRRSSSSSRSSSSGGATCSIDKTKCFNAKQIIIVVICLAVILALFVLYCVVTSYYGRWTRHRAARKKKQAMEAANLKDKEQQGGQDAGDGYQPAEADKGKSDSEHSTKNGYQSVKTEEDDKIMSSSGSALGLYDGIPPQTQGSIETLPLYNPNHDKGSHDNLPGYSGSYVTMPMPAVSQ